MKSFVLVVLMILADIMSSIDSKRPRGISSAWACGGFISDPALGRFWAMKRKKSFEAVHYPEHFYRRGETRANKGKRRC